MKTPLAFVLVALVSGGALVRATSSDTAAVSATFIEPDAPEVAEIRALGERAISRIGGTMVNEAAVTVAKEGAVNALTKCHLKDIAMTNGCVGGMPRIVAMKRTSVRLRDPANAPDAADQLALARMQLAVDAGNPPKILVQRIDQPGGSHEWRVYRPLGITRVCLTCHGPAAEMSPELQAALKARFPNDPAAGYGFGEWRGLLRVTVADAAPSSAPAPKTPAKKS